jgi:hypothetical protein
MQDAAKKCFIEWWRYAAALANITPEGPAMTYHAPLYFHHHDNVGHGSRPCHLAAQASVSRQCVIDTIEGECWPTQLYANCGTTCYRALHDASHDLLVFHGTYKSRLRHHRLGNTFALFDRTAPSKASFIMILSKASENHRCECSNRPRPSTCRTDGECRVLLCRCCIHPV